MTEIWRKSLEKSGAFGTLVTDLSKSFDCLPYELLIAKLQAFGIDTLSLKELHSYLTKWKQRVKLNGMYSLWSEISFGVPQGSIFGPLLSDIFLCDLFQFSPDLDITKCTDDNSLHSTSINLNNVLYNVEKMSNTLLKRFTNSLLKTNEKSHIFLQTLHKKLKLLLEEWLSPTVNAKSF